MKTAASLFIVMVLVTAAFTQNSPSKVQQPLPETYKIFPPGEWTFSAHPFMGKGFDTRPVVVTSVKTDLATFSVVAIRIRNISSKSVTGVSFKWSLTNEKNPKVTLKEGETPLGNVGQELASTHESILTVPVFSFLDIHKKFVKKGRLEGNFRVDIAVSRLLFSDGTFWNEGQAIVISPQYFGSFVKAAYFERSGPLQVSPFTVSPACAKQRCVHGGARLPDTHVDRAKLMNSALTVATAAVTRSAEPYPRVTATSFSEQRGSAEKLGPPKARNLQNRIRC